MNRTLMGLEIFSGKWRVRLNPATNVLIWALNSTVFLFLDLLDLALCTFFRIVDGFFEGEDSSSCYCRSTRSSEEQHSETLYRRRNVFREMGSRREYGTILSGKLDGDSRWSDCGCETCLSWMKSGSLYIRVVEPSHSQDIHENVVFLHGFLSSSSFWTETVFPNISEPVRRNYRLLAVDLLGFGRSPKPRKCLYTLNDHLEMLESSVLRPFRLNSFHLVAHSMGCFLALALAAKFPESVKSITLVAPLFFPSSAGSLDVLEKLAKRQLWPPLSFGMAVMSWYEHVGRCVCFVICQNHRALEKLMKLVTWRRDLHFMVMDMTRHTHHSAWHTMHNVLCGGAQQMEGFLEALSQSGVEICIVHGERDKIVPAECIESIKAAAPAAGIDLIRGADHSSIVLCKDNSFTKYLENIWTSNSTVGR